MSGKEMSRHDQVLLGLVYSFQMGAMQQLGKVQDPATGELHRDLDQARTTISVLEMLKAKCRTDTPEDVLRVLDQTVMELQMNYVDELKKDEAARPEGQESVEEEKAEPAKNEDARNEEETTE